MLKREPILMTCEGSKGPTHFPAVDGRVPVVGMCKMCGQWVELELWRDEGWLAVPHQRQDILAMLDRGDYD